MPNTMSQPSSNISLATSPRSAAISVAMGALTGAQGLPVGSAAAVILGMSVAETLAMPNRPSNVGSMIAMMVAYGMAGWWVGKNIFPPPTM